jgi:pilus assembly protein CpaE
MGTTTVERLAPVSRRVSTEPPQIEPLAYPVDALAFVNDPTTAEILAALFGATGQGRVQFGGLSAAIQVLQSAPCPQLLVIDISGMTDPLGHLDRLADLCPEGTAVVLIGGGQDTALAAELRAMGIVHFLTKPFDPERMRAAIMEAAGASHAQFSDPAAAYAPPPAAPAQAGYTDEFARNGELPPIAEQSFAESPAAPAAEPLSKHAAPPPGEDPFSRRAAPAPGVDVFSANPASMPASAAPYAAPAFAASEMRTATVTAQVPVSDPFSAPPQPGPGIPPPATAQMPQFAMQPGVALAPAPQMQFVPVADIEPLPRPVDLLAFLTEAQTAALVAGIIGPHGSAGRVQPGGINAAISFLKDNASPKILLVDISGVPEPMARVDALAEVCAPGTMVIATGVANDVALYRDLKNSGLYEYLVKPIQPEVLKAVVLEAASGGAKVEPESAKPVLMVVGTRGGVGASTVAINIAGTLARQGKKTILLDLDLQFGSIALTLDIDPGHGLREALDRPERVDSMFLNSSAVKVGENLHVLAAEEGVNEPVIVSGEPLATLLHELQRHFDAIVVDMPRHVAAGNWEAISRAHAVLIVADLSLVGIRDTTRLLTAAKEIVDPAKVKLMISSTGGDRGAKIDRKEFETALSRKVDYVLPEDSKSVSTANRAGRTVVDVAAGSKLAAALRDACIDLVGQAEGEGAEAEQKKRGVSLFRRKKK